MSFTKTRSDLRLDASIIDRANHCSSGQLGLCSTLARLGLLSSTAHQLTSVQRVISDTQRVISALKVIQFLRASLQVQVVWRGGEVGMWNKTRQTARWKPSLSLSQTAFF